ncbi:uncharacterized protein LOC143329167 isoform X2 [Chaetodon auriga]|uniref:uncharacterized protein LOC143329167 isoform X2 n=1 Tax=Chaetodon auriga TaxID=39042 RepID=UPI004032F00E
MEVAVCRHGFLLKALNMYRGEIFAYPLYLQKELMPAKPQFFAMDVACKYWPYLEKAASALPALQELTKMKPFLSVMHARAHATKCEIKWSGRNQEGAGTTAGEEVEQVNSYLSRCALTTKYMSKAARVDMLTLHALGWNHKKRASLHQALSTRYVKTCQRLQDETARLAVLKTELHCSDEMASQWIPEVNEWAAGDSSKLRHRLRRRLGEDKKLLLQAMQRYNSLVPDSAAIDVAVVENAFAGESTVSLLWPWEVHGNANITIKKRLYDQVMLTMRLQEEKNILVLEMAQHCTWLQKQAEELENKVAENGSSKMERKRKGGAEKLRDKKLALQTNAAKCAKISDMFAMAGPSSAPVANDSGGGGGDIDQGHAVKPASSKFIQEFSYVHPFGLGKFTIY